LHREIGASARVIEMQLSELATYGVVTKRIHTGFPLCVEYSLTTVGESILPILEQLNAWGLQNKEIVQQVNNYQSTEKSTFNQYSTICQ
ncbi:MAG TPA: helix-turn-helix domain-containing protein, partial [Chitinophaga sp.]|nr:helix-turn-helix domain-containing protein [Chitinophaga sp.]